MKYEEFKYCFEEYSRRIDKTIDFKDFTEMFDAMHLLEKYEKENREKNIPLPNQIHDSKKKIYKTYSIKEIANFRRALSEVQVGYLSMHTNLVNSAFFSDFESPLEFVSSICDNGKSIVFDLQKQLVCGEPGFGCYCIEGVRRLKVSNLPLREDELLLMLPPCARSKRDLRGRVVIDEYKGLDEFDEIPSDEIDYDTIGHAFEGY